MSNVLTVGSRLMECLVMSKMKAIRLLALASAGLLFAGGCSLTSALPIAIGAGIVALLGLGT